MPDDAEPDEHPQLAAPEAQARKTTSGHTR